MRYRIPAVLFVVSVAGAAHAGAGQPGDPALVFRWSPTEAKVVGGAATDATGKVKLKVVGNPGREKIGPGEGTTFDGTGSCLVIAEDIAKERQALPARDFTVSAWVNLSETTEFGSIIGAVQDNGDAEKGWLLGYTTDSFYLGVASKGGADADGKLTYLKGATKIATGRWYHVVGTYDGATMRVYVNGKLDAESKEQSGEILYPEHAAYTVGAYVDDDERHPMHGAIADLRLYSRVLGVDAITQEASAGAALTSWTPVVDPGETFVVKPYVQFATMDSIRVMWETGAATTGVVEYGTQLPFTQKAESSAGQTLHEVQLSGLEAQTQYLYRVTCRRADGTEFKSDTLTLQTAVPADSPFAFAVIGDTQKNAPVIATLQKFVYSLRPNFEIHCGDVVDRGPDKDEWTKELLAGSNVLMSRVPLYPSIGNHEQNHSLYYQYFSLPAPEYYYTYTYGNAQFFVLDTNKPVTPGSEQYEWLDRELGKSTATWKFAYHHHPVYSSDENDYGDTYKGPSTFGDMRVRPLAKLFEKHHLDVDFCGHIHVYERSWPIREDKAVEKNGVVYVTSGGGGGGLEAAAPTRTWFSRRFFSGHHVCYVGINGKTLEFQAFDLEGRLFDQFEIRKGE
jgi:hypothetical protein